jgi:hypothetical protein
LNGLRVTSWPKAIAAFARGFTRHLVSVNLRYAVLYILNEIAVEIIGIYYLWVPSAFKWHSTWNMDGCGSKQFAGIIDWQLA